MKQPANAVEELFGQIRRRLVAVGLGQCREAGEIGEQERVRPGTLDS